MFARHSIIWIIISVIFVLLLITCAIGCICSSSNSNSNSNKEGFSGNDPKYLLQYSTANTETEINDVATSIKKILSQRYIPFTFVTGSIPNENMFLFKDSYKNYMKLCMPDMTGTVCFNLNPNAANTSAASVLQRMSKFKNDNFLIFIIWQNKEVSEGISKYNQVTYNGYEHPLIARMRVELLEGNAIRLYSIESMSDIESLGISNGWNSPDYVKYETPTFNQDPYQGILLIPKGNFTDYFIVKWSYHDGLLPSILDNKLIANSEFEMQYSNFKKSIQDILDTNAKKLPREGDVFQPIWPDNPNIRENYIIDNSNIKKLKLPQNSTLDAMGLSEEDPYRIGSIYMTGYPLDMSGSNDYYPTCRLENGGVYIEKPTIYRSSPYAGGNTYFIDDGMRRFVPTSLIARPATVSFESQYSSAIMACPIGCNMPSCSAYTDSLYRCVGSTSNYEFRMVSDGSNAYQISAIQHAAAKYPSFVDIPYCSAIDLVCNRTAYNSNIPMIGAPTLATPILDTTSNIASASI